MGEASKTDMTQPRSGQAMIWLWLWGFAGGEVDEEAL